MEKFALPEHLLEQIRFGKKVSAQGYRGRFAPSPTGPMHLGNIRTALLSWLRARMKNGLWFLRIDDLDIPRNRLGAIQSIQDDLLWLGLEWNGPIVFQSKRLGLYSSVLSALKRQGKLYPCRCTRSVLANISESKGAPTIYPGTCRDLNNSWGLENGRLPSLRIRVDNEFSSISGDIILRRSDGFIAYNLATVVDDLTSGINEVVRGDDLRMAMCGQIAIINTIGEEPMKYKYVPVMCDGQGKKLSKRDHSLGLNALRKEGVEAHQIIGSLAASMKILPVGSVLSSKELLSELIKREGAYNSISSVYSD